MAQWALSYDGVDDTVNCGDINAIDGATQLTVEAWVKVNPGDAATASHILRKQLVVAFGAGWFTPGKALFWIHDGSWKNSGESITSIDDGAWHYIVGVYDGTFLRIYVDGVEENSNNIGATTLTSNAEPVYLGSEEAITQFWKGIIDEVRISNISRTADEISYHWNGGAGIQFEVDANTVALWRKNEGSGSTIFDETANNHDGTITGATWVAGFPFVTEIISSDTAVGTEALTQTVSLVKADSGSGVDSLTSYLAELVKADTGSAADAILNRAIVLAETGSGIEALTLLATLIKADNGSGLDALVALTQLIEKFSSDTGSGIDALTGLNIALIRADSGTGVDTSRLLAAILASDNATAVDLSSLIKALFASDSGKGFDKLRVLIRTPAKGGDIKLPPGTPGEVSIPRKKVSLPWER